MTIDELVAKLDEPAKQEQETKVEGHPVVETAPTQTEENVMPYGQQFEEYCESKKRK